MKNIAPSTTVRDRFTDRCLLQATVFRDVVSSKDRAHTCRVGQMIQDLAELGRRLD